MNIEVETTLAKNLRTTEGMKAYDAVCKRLLVNREILAWIMQSCLEEYRDMDRRDIEACIEGNPQIGTIAVFPDEVAESETEANQPRQTKLPEQIRGANVEDSTVKENTNTYDIRFYATAPGTDGLIEIIINLECYRDVCHHRPEYNRYIFDCIRQGENRITRENLDKTLLEMYEFAKDYDYEAYWQ